MYQNKKRPSVGPMEVKQGNVIDAAVLTERMPTSYALMTHIDNLCATYGEETVKTFIERHLKMKRVKTQIKVA